MFSIRSIRAVFPDRWFRYGVAVSIVVAALLGMLLLDPWLHMTRTPFLLFYGAVVISAWYGGLQPGLLATTLAVVLSYHFFLQPNPAFTVSLESLTRVGIFTLQGGLISLLSESLHRTKRRAEVNLHRFQASDECFRLALNNSDLAVFQQDRALRYQWIHNPQSVSSAEDLIGKSDFDLFAPAEAAQLSTLKQGVISSGRPSREVVLLTIDGNPRYYDLIVEPLRDRQGQIQGVTCAAINITTIKQAEAERNQLLAREQAARAEAEAMQQRLTFLDTASTALAVSLDYETTLQSVVNLLVPHFTDLCTVDIVQADLAINPMLAVAAKDPAKAELCRQISQRYPIDLNNANQPSARVFQTGRAAAVSQITETHNQAIAHNEHHLQLLRQLGIQSIICVPLLAHTRVFGVLSLMLIDSNRRYGLEDLTLVEELGRRVGLAIENARLHRALQQANQHKDESLALLNALLASSPIGLALLDTNLRYLHINEALAAMNGLPRSQHLNRTVSEVLPDWAPELEAILRQVMQTKTPLLNQALNGETNPSGVYRACLANYFPVCLPDEQVIGVGVATMNVTELKRAEAALRESEERFRSLVMASSQIVWRADAQGRFFEVPGWSAFTGQSEAELLQGNTDAIHPDDLPEVRQAWQQAVRTHNPYQVEHRIRKYDGTYEYFAIRGVPMLDADGQVREWIGMTTNINDRKQAQAAQERVLQREQAARTEAEAANRIKDEFLAVLSHELRSPLNPILGWAKLLRDRPFTEEAKNRALETIERNAKLQARLIEDLLDVSRILRGKLSLNVAPVDLVLITQAAIETVRLAAEAKAIQLHLTLAEEGAYPTQLRTSLPHATPSTPLQVLGDASRLQQVIWNLLSNAVKFTPEHGQVHLRLSVISGPVAIDPLNSLQLISEQVNASDRWAQIIVQDTGKGIDPVFLPHVFDYFRQADSTTTRNFGGLGLGLAIVRHLVELHGGSVKADSAGEGQGATFTVQLPLLRESGNQPEALHLDPFLSASMPLKHTRILVVDDEADMREYVTVALQQVGAEVLAVSSAEEALAALATIQPDVLLSDLGMPNVDGYMLIRHIRHLPPSQGGAIPAIALTAYASESDQHQALNAGFQCHLAKPIDPDQLVAAIVALKTAALEMEHDR